MPLGTGPDYSQSYFKRVFFCVAILAIIQLKLAPSSSDHKGGQCACPPGGGGFLVRVFSYIFLQIFQPIPVNLPCLNLDHLAEKLLANPVEFDSLQFNEFSNLQTTSQVLTKLKGFKNNLLNDVIPYRHNMFQFCTVTADFLYNH